MYQMLEDTCIVLHKGRDRIQTERLLPCANLIPHDGRLSMGKRVYFYYSGHIGELPS
jgi:hypothetical protein